MKTMRSTLNQAGFTLIEILVTLILVSLLVAAVFPVVTQQVGQADAPRLSNDLVNVRSGMELFYANLRNRQAKGLDELVNAVDLTGNDINGDAYTPTHTNRWNGPYIDATIPAGGGTITTGYDATIQNDFTLYDSTTDTPGATGDFVALVIGAPSVGGFASDFDAINDLIDGDSEASATTTGKLRMENTSTTAYYLAIPSAD